MIYIFSEQNYFNYIHMKRLIFSAICGIMLFATLLGTACGNVKNENYVSKDKVEFAIDPLDAKITEIEMKNSSLFSIKGEEQIDETDEAIIRHCPVKFVNSESGEVIDTVFVITENY